MPKLSHSNGLTMEVISYTGCMSPSSLLASYWTIVVYVYHWTTSDNLSMSCKINIPPCFWIIFESICNLKLHRLTEESKFCSGEKSPHHWRWHYNFDHGWNQKRESAAREEVSFSMILSEPIILDKNSDKFFL